MGMKTRFAFLFAALVLIAGPPLAASAAPAAATATVHIKNFTFVPALLTVTAGTSVTFVNDDEEPHTATALDKSFDSDALDTNEKWQHTFSKPGSYAYFCEMHPYMKGTLVVKAPQ
jgi:plastocyanin